MATIKPFAALRPKPELASRVCELPYDVMSSDEARQMAAGNPFSFLHVSKPEIDLPPGTDLHDPTVYAKGKESFQRLISDETLRQDPQPCFYLYRQIMGNHSQVGLVAAASCQEYLDGVIKKHEFTRPDKEDDRVRHMEALNSQTGPVFLTYRAAATMDEFVAREIQEQPDMDFIAKDGVRHTAWTVGDAGGIRFIEEQFAKIESLYIADGHHRSAAAARVYQKRSGTPASASAQTGGESATHGIGDRHAETFLTVIFPHNQMQILPYNRVLRDLNGHNPGELRTKLEAIFTTTAEGNPTPSAKHEIGLLLNGQWHSLKFRPEITATDDPIQNLDVSLLQQHVLAPLFGIEDPRTSQRINFVGGIRGTAELEKLVGSGEYACAISMFPTSIEDLMAIANADGIMPPKSTWFEPKLRDAMFCHMI